MIPCLQIEIPILAGLITQEHTAISFVRPQKRVLLPIQNCTCIVLYRAVRSSFVFYMCKKCDQTYITRLWS